MKKLTKLQGSLVSLNAIKNILLKVKNVFPNIPPGVNKKAEELKLLCNFIFTIQLCNFCDELKTDFPKNIKAKNIRIFKLLEPFDIPVKKSVKNRLQIVRSRHIAHNNREKPGGDFIPYQKTVSEYEIPTNHSEYIFLADCAIVYVCILQAYFKKDWEESENKFNIYYEKELKDANKFCTDVESSQDVKDKIWSIINDNKIFEEYEKVKKKSSGDLDFLPQSPD